MKSADDLRGLLQKAVSYRRWPALLDDGLRRAALLGGLTTLAGLAFMLALPALHRKAMSSSLIARRELVLFLEGLARNAPLWGAINVTTLGVYLLLIIVTRGWLRGRPEYHWAAWAMALVGAANACIVALELALLGLNLALLLVVGLVLGLVLYFWVVGSVSR